MPRTKGAHCQVVKVGTELRRQAWQSMRIMRRFTRGDLMSTTAIGESNLRKFLNALIAVDIVRVVKPRDRRITGGSAVMQLVVDSGPLPPITWTNGEVFDPNTKLVHYLTDADEQLAGEPAGGSRADQREEGGAQAGSVAGNDRPCAEGLYLHSTKNIDAQVEPLLSSPTWLQPLEFLGHLNLATREAPAERRRMIVSDLGRAGHASNQDKF
jgi:hypothetical protein